MIISSSHSYSYVSMYGAFKSIPDFMPDTDQASVESRNGQLTHHCVKCEVKLFVCQCI